MGVDIGCGMIAVRTQYSLQDLPKDRKRLREDIERAIPLSAGHNNRKVMATAEPRIAELEKLAAKAGFDPAQYAGKVGAPARLAGFGQPLHRGVRGRDRTRVWLFLHSGSRGVGNKIAQHHIGVAQQRDPEAADPAAGPGPRLPGGGHAESSTGTSRSCGGPSTSPC